MSIMMIFNGQCRRYTGHRKNYWGTPLIAGWVAEVVLFAVVVFVFELVEPG
jgi:hypothetical protein